MSTLYSSIANSNETPNQFFSKRTGVGSTSSINHHLSTSLFVTPSSDLSIQLTLNELITATERTIISTTNDIDTNAEQTNRSNTTSRQMSTQSYQQDKTKRAG